MSVKMSKFQYHADSKVLTADMSELGFEPGHVYKHGSHIGGYPKFLEVFSEKTGNTVLFEVDHAAYAQNEGWDGEMMSYIPAPGEQSKLLISNVSLTLFND